MNKCISVALILLALLMGFSSHAQDDPQPFSGRAYWQETKNDRYINLQQKLDSNEEINDADALWYGNYQMYLESYWDRMNPDQKREYYENRADWDRELQRQQELDKAEAEAMATKQDNERIRSDSLALANTNEQDPLGRAGAKERYNLLNGLYGYLYGWAIIGAFDIESTVTRATLPFGTAGLALLIPIINQPKYENMTYGSALLARHGKFAGALNGLALGGLINDFDDASLPVGLGALFSIAMGEAGFQLGKKHDWSIGRISMFRHYGIVAPITGSLIAASTSTTGRSISLGWLIGSGAGYFLGNTIYNKYPYTQGDIRASTTFTGLSALTGFGILVATEQYQDASLIYLVPAISTIGGSLLSHRLIRGINLSNKQAFWSSTAATGGILVGLAIAAAIQGDESLYAFLPAAGGFAAHFGMLGMYRKQNARAALGLSIIKNSVYLGLNPQNYFVNEMLSSKVNPREFHKNPTATITAPVLELNYRF